MGLQVFENCGHRCYHRFMIGLCIVHVVTVLVAACASWIPTHADCSTSAEFRTGIATEQELRSAPDHTEPLPSGLLERWAKIVLLIITKPTFEQCAWVLGSHGMEIEMYKHLYLVVRHTGITLVFDKRERLCNVRLAPGFFSMRRQDWELWRNLQGTWRYYALTIFPEGEKRLAAAGGPDVVTVEGNVMIFEAGAFSAPLILRIMPRTIGSLLQVEFPNPTVNENFENWAMLPSRYYQIFTWKDGMVLFCPPKHDHRDYGLLLMLHQ